MKPLSELAMKRRSFFKQSLLATLATAIAPALWAMGATNFPEFENGVALRKIYRFYGGGRWERIRLKDSKPGDVLTFLDEDDNGGFLRVFYAYIDGHPISPNKACHCWGVSGMTFTSLDQVLDHRGAQKFFIKEKKPMAWPVSAERQA